MAAGLIKLRVVLATTYIPLTDTTLVASGTITNEGTNTAYLYAAGETYEDVELGAGKQFRVSGIDLSTISVKGTAGEIVTFIGQSGAAGL
jgi:hypothetical protein